MQASAVSIHAQQSAENPAAELIAGRYRVERTIAIGGMGEVLAAIDTSTGRRVALKRLLPGSDQRFAAMFEREYRTLVRLQHPRIVEVYDYGLAHGRRYYTMELLDGDDLRANAPLPFSTACRYLRDIASSLALLHARRLVHRDVSPRNVHVTREGRCKLLDFGALANFGPTELVVGTPPYVPPEALERKPLDHRSDLFSLGAVGYFLLTGKHAFPARALNELPGLWSLPTPRPSEALRARLQEGEPLASTQALPEIPKALDDLLMALLTRDPLGRPESAMEVIDRLAAIGELAPEHDGRSARSYLHGAQTVGRERERERLQKRLERSFTGAGSSVVIDAAPGLGSTRLLTELALDAQLAGATARVVDAKLHAGLYGVAHGLIDGLVVALPEQSVRAAGEHAEQLARFSPTLAARLPDVSTESVHDTSALPPGELRRRVQVALAEWLFALAKEQPLVLAIDNAQDLDEASAALLAAVAHAARGHSILLVVARKPAPESAATAALRAIEDAGSTLTLRPLSREQTQALVRGIFDDVPNVARLGEWLGALSGGNPQACLDLARHLVETSVLRFKGGVWVLPQELSASELPADVGQTLDARLGRMDEAAQRLAELLCVQRGVLARAHCLQLALREQIPEPAAALERLEREEVVISHDRGLAFAHESMRERIYGRLPAPRRKALHLQLGHMLRRAPNADTNTLIDAGFHLLSGGAETEGADLLADAGTALTHAADEIAASVPALRAALEVFRKQKRPKHQLARVLAPLAIAGYRVDRRLGDEFGDEAIAVFRDLIGLSLSARLRPLLGPKLSLYLGLGFGVVRALMTHGLRGPGVFRRTVSTFFTCVVSLASAATICFDIKRTQQCVKAIEPLAALGHDHPAAISYRFAKTLARLPEDRLAEVVAGCEQLIARLRDETRPVRGLPEDSRLLLLGGAWYALGALSCMRDGPYALRCAEQLDALGLRLYAMAAEQVRTMYYALRGDLARAKQHREQVELHAIQAGTGWQVEIWSPCGATLVHTLTRDVIGIKRVVEELDRLIVELPTLRRHHQLARGVYHELQGDLEVAMEIRSAILEGAPPRAFIGWPPLIGSHAAALIALGRAREAKAFLQVALDTMTEADQPFIAIYQKIWTSLAMADASLGDYAAATTLLDSLIAKHAPDEGPVTMGNLHATRMRVALMMDDAQSAELHLAAMERYFRPTGNPALIGQCERLRRELSRGCSRHGAAGDLSSPLASSSELDTLRSLLGQQKDRTARWQRALELVCGWARAESGVLFMCENSERAVHLAAAMPLGELGELDEPVREALERSALLALQDALDAEDEATSAVDFEHLPSLSAQQAPPAVVQGRSYRVLPLVTPHARAVVAVGAFVLCEGDEPFVAPNQRLLDAIARSLYQPTSASASTVRPPRQ